MKNCYFHFLCISVINLFFQLSLPFPLSSFFPNTFFLIIVIHSFNNYQKKILQLFFKKFSFFYVFLYKFMTFVLIEV